LGDNVICGYHLAILRPKDDVICGEYLYHILQNTNVHNHFIRLANGITRYGLTSSSIGKAIIPVLSLKEQERIANIFISIDEEIKALRMQTELIRDQKKGLMQVLLTGRIRAISPLKD